jgi:hypothetical protein
MQCFPFNMAIPHSKKRTTWRERKGALPAVPAPSSNDILSLFWRPRATFRHGKLNTGRFGFSNQL